MRNSLNFFAVLEDGSCFPPSAFSVYEVTVRLTVPLPGVKYLVVEPVPGSRAIELGFRV